MFKFLRANFYIGLVWVLSPIIMTCYVAILIGLMIICLVTGDKMSEALKGWALIVYVDFKWFVLVIKHGLIETLKAYKEIRNER